MISVVFCAVIGGLIASFIGFFDEPKEYAVRHSRSYWGRLLLFNPLCAGFLVWVYLADGAAITHFLALNVGLSAPLFLKQAVSSAAGSTLQGSNVELS